MIRKRVKIRNFKIISGGTSVPTVANLRWGPDFGGNNGDRFFVSKTLALTTIGLIANLNVNGNLSLTNLSLTGNLNSNNLIDLEDLSLLGELNVNNSIGLADLSITGDLNIDNLIGLIDLADLSIAGNLNSNNLIDLEDVSLAGDLSSNNLIDSVTYQTGQIIAFKDSFVPTATSLGSCNDNTNKNGQDLRVGNILLIENIPKIYMAWDLTSLPNNATIISAILSIKPVSAPTLSHTYNIRGISAANEGWNETTIVCNNAPAVTNPNQSYSQPNNANDLNINITSAFGSYIAGRLGSTNTCTLVIEDQAVTGQMQVYESKDQGTNNHLGPRLQLIFTVPV